MNMYTEELTVEDLQERKAAAQMLLASKRGADLYVKANGMFIIRRSQLDDFMTCNESQAVEKWNSLNQKQ